jgi:hypothetical protein
MLKQLSLLDDIPGSLAGLIPAVRAAMNRAAGADPEGRKLLVDRLNDLAAQTGIRLTQGSAKAISKDTLDKWLAPTDREQHSLAPGRGRFLLGDLESGAAAVLLRGVAWM